MNNKIAVFPGSFDPFTIGHESIVKRALPLFDKIVIAIGINSIKNYLFDLEKRKAIIDAAFNAYKKVEIATYQGLTIDFCKSINAKFLLRGIRNSVDLNFEQPIAQMNQKMSGIETIFLLTEPELSAISSTILRDIYKNGGDISPYIPVGVEL